jgi:hypothetical protein
LNGKTNPHSISLASTPDPIYLENAEEGERLEQRGHTTMNILELLGKQNSLDATALANPTTILVKSLLGVGIS